MAEFDIEGAVVRLYDDASLTGDMTDEPAKRVLKWAEAQLENAAKTSADEAAFEEAQQHVRQLVKAFNQYISAQQGGDFEAQQEAVAKATERASSLGYDPQPMTAEAFAVQSADVTEMSAVEMLLRMIEGQLPTEVQPEEVVMDHKDSDESPVYRFVEQAETRGGGNPPPSTPPDDGTQDRAEDEDDLKWEY